MSLVYMAFTLVLVALYIWYTSIALKDILTIKKLPNDPLLTLCMTKDEFIVHRRKKRIQLGVSFFLCILLIGSVIFYRGWVRGEYGTVPIPEINQLKIVRGIFFHEVSGGRYSYHVFGLRDTNSGKIILKAFSEFCGNSESLIDYTLYPATVWYTEGPGNRNGWMYQLEVQGRLVCTLDEANKKAEARNKEIYLIYLRDITWFFSMASLVGVFFLRRYMQEVYMKDDQR